MYLTNAINRYKEAIKNEKSKCCAIAGSEIACQKCPNYQIRVNKITLKLIEFEMNNRIDQEWEYYPLWQQIVTISNELNNVGLSLIDEEIDIKKITTVLQRSKKAIANLEIKKEKLTNESE